MINGINSDSIQAFAHIRAGASSLASIKVIAEPWIDQCIGLMFPELCQAIDCSPESVEADIENLWNELCKLRRLVGHQGQDIEQAAKTLLNIRESLLEDAHAALEGDPAAQSLSEVIVAYPGFRALAHHRIAHELYRAGYPLVPRIISEKAHRETGIDIHPGAQIGRRCFIDHGTGVVVGETAVVGSNVKIYQGVTLGALSVAKAFANTKRHPTVGDRVVLYANSTVLGGETVIGSDSIIGGNAWITESVPPNSRIHRNS